MAILTVPIIDIAPYWGGTAARKREMAQQVAGLIDYPGDVCGLTYGEAAAALLVREASGNDASVALMERLAGIERRPRPAK